MSYETFEDAVKAKPYVNHKRNNRKHRLVRYGMPGVKKSYPPGWYQGEILDVTLRLKEE